ncbi:hypothetical protein OSB04_011815 [Centaurea solstitialis]|uniref:Uncharacterized protein n=1 Tax=Centaurea solstitialis TaxID=347529 RepID=A0AA38TKX0_9ASTR|nr:hypothetical protein OSB04_011815 [Centaurea solstitialis]
MVGARTKCNARARVAVAVAATVHAECRDKTRTLHFAPRIRALAPSLYCIKSWGVSDRELTALRVAPNSFKDRSISVQISTTYDRCYTDNMDTGNFRLMTQDLVKLDSFDGSNYTRWVTKVPNTKIVAKDDDDDDDDDDDNHSNELCI